MAHRLDEMIDLLILNEEACAGYYEACQQAIPEFAETWKALQKQELNHAEIFRLLKTAQPGGGIWLTGGFVPQVVRSAAKDVMEKTAALKAGRLNSRYAISFIAEIENSLLEKEVFSSLGTNNWELKKLISQAGEETLHHRKLLADLNRKVASERSVEGT